MKIRALTLFGLACVACSAQQDAPSQDPNARDTAPLNSSPGASAVDASTGTSPGATTPAASPIWVGTWSASPQSSGTTFNGQTLRQIVHTSIGGSTVRIQISNAFGNQTLRIADVHIALRASNSSIVTSSDKTLTFSGQGTASIAAGSLAISDPIPFNVPQLGDLAISMYLPQGTGPATSHQQGTQTNYVASGDVSGNASLSNPQQMGSYYFLANVDVQTTASPGAVVTLGASITDGVAASQDSNRRWPNDLAVRIVNSGRSVGVLNQGISGNRLLSDGAGQSALNRFDRDVLAQPGVKWVIFSDDPINDVGGGGGPSGAQLIGALSQLVSRAHQAGIKFYCSTLTPFEGSGGWTQNGETARGQVNAFIRGANSGCDGIVDQDTATHDPAHPTRYLPAYDAGDHLHPNEAGLQAIANAVDLALFDGAHPPPPPPPSSTVISLRAHANGQLVTAENAGAAALIANRSAIGGWEEFDEVDQDNGNVALRAHANGKYVTAENAGAASLIANRDAVGLWETFQLVHNGDGSVSLKAQVNGKYVTADNAGASALIANRAAIGPWEEFDLIGD